MRVDVLGAELELLPQKAIWWPAKKIIMLADLHLGKVNHFRKSGIPVPTSANDKNWENLIELISAKKPERLICLGDLFHSHYNFEWELMGELIRSFPNVTFELVLGNHDILSDNQYIRTNISVYNDLIEEPFLLTHHPLEDQPNNLYNLAGHIHPGVTLHGKGRQAMTLPCFYFGKRQGYLPAFGMFTGFVRIRPKQDDRIFVIAANEILEV